jgi:hypothetical protein
MSARNASRKYVAPKGIRKEQVTGIKEYRAGHFDGQLHAHGCSLCGRYYTDVCKDSGEDAICKDCIPHHYGRPSWEQTADPQLCCRSNSVKATEAQIQSFRLAGRSDWWICLGCSRTHPYNPTTTRRSDP